MHICARQYDAKLATVKAWHTKLKELSHCNPAVGAHGLAGRDQSAPVFQHAHPCLAVCSMWRISGHGLWPGATKGMPRSIAATVSSTGLRMPKTMLRSASSERQFDEHVQLQEENSSSSTALPRSTAS